MSHTQSTVTTATLLSLTSIVQAHNHITVDTASGTPGDQIVIRAGFLGDETSYSIIDGAISFDGTPITYDLVEEVTEPGFVGWLGGDELVLTSDFYFGTGRLEGGDFYFEIAGVSQVTKGAQPVQFAWGEVKGASLNFTATSSAASRLERSFGVGNGKHAHGQVFAIDTPGEYEITLIAWDATGTYTDSAPVTFRVNAVPPPCPGDANADRTVSGADLSVLLSTFGQSVVPGSGADFNADGLVNGADLSVLLTQFGSSC